VESALLISVNMDVQEAVKMDLPALLHPPHPLYLLSLISPNKTKNPKMKKKKSQNPCKKMTMSSSSNLPPPRQPKRLKQ
jgi:hypothetical protein